MPHFTWRKSIAILLLSFVLMACNNQTPTPTIAPTAPPPIGATAVPTSAPSSIGNVPQNISIESQDTVLKLTWQAVPNAIGYFVYRDGNEQPLNHKPVNEAAFTDIGLTNGRSYSYTIAAVDASNQPGPKSAPVTAAPKSK